MLPRHQKFLDALPRNKNKVLPSAIEAGYSESYARKRGQTLYKTALKAQAKDIIEMVENKPMNKEQARQFMSDIVGINRDTIMERLRNIATQEKDYGTALKVLGVLAREHGVEMDTEQVKVTVPVLTVHTTNNPLVEPPKQDTP